MQVSVHSGLIQRLVYYACSLYVDQLEAGQNYASLRPAISICLLNNVLFRESETAHHRFRLYDPDQRRELRNAIEVHTVELTKYNLDEATISRASKIEQWSFFLLFADQYEPDRLRELLPAVEFQQAISAIEQIAQKTEDRIMYDQRDKAQRDYQWAIEGAHSEGLEEGLERGLEQGLEQGRNEGLVEGVGKGVIAGKIQVLQQLLGETETSSMESISKTVEELSSQLADLQARLDRPGLKS